MKNIYLSKKQLILIRRIDVAGIPYTIRPSFVMPYLTGIVDEIEKALFMRKFNVFSGPYAMCLAEIQCAGIEMHRHWGETVLLEQQFNEDIKEVLKGSRWILVKNRSDLSSKEESCLCIILDNCQELGQLYLPKMHGN